MELYEEVTDQILHPLVWLQDKYYTKFKNEIKEKAKTIAPILEGISSIKIENTVTIYGNYIYRAQYRNIKNNRDLTRQEFRGAIQSYLLGFKNVSMKQSFISIESALLTVHDERIKTNQLDINKVKHPFTFGKSKNLAISKKYGFIKDKKIKQILNNMVKMRNGFIHQYNFLSSLINLYKEELPNLMSMSELFDQIIPMINTMDKEDVNEYFNLFGFNLPIESMDKIGTLVESDYFTQMNRDVKHAVSSITTLSDFKWCTTQENLNFMDSIIGDFWDSEEHMEFGFDIIGYLSYQLLNDAFTVLKFLDFF